MTARVPGRVLGDVCLLGVTHAVVDAASALTVLRAGGDLTWHLSPYLLVILYDLLAFGLQAPLGALLDRRRIYRMPTVLGIAVLLVASLGARVSPLTTAIVVGIGNALFHVGAGAQVLSRSDGRATDAGVFVAPGAIGLAVGMALGQLRRPPYLPVAALLALCLGVLVLREPISGQKSENSSKRHSPILQEKELFSGIGWLLLLGLLGSVFVRAFVGLGACYQCPRLPMLVFGAPAAACLAKCAGGYLADRFGWIAIGVGGIALAAPFVAYNHGVVALALLGLGLCQLTMPVSLAATYRVFPSKPGVAFGLPCLALVAGSAPSFFDPQKRLYSDGLLLWLAIASAVVFWFALRQVQRFGDGRLDP